jgi:hypothetical protein
MPRIVTSPERLTDIRSSITCFVPRNGFLLAYSRNYDLLRDIFLVSDLMGSSPARETALQCGLFHTFCKYVEYLRMRNDCRCVLAESHKTAGGLRNPVT